MGIVKYRKNETWSFVSFQCNLENETIESVLSLEIDKLSQLTQYKNYDIDIVDIKTAAVSEKLLIVTIFFAKV